MSIWNWLEQLFGKQIIISMILLLLTIFAWERKHMLSSLCTAQRLSAKAIGLLYSAQISLVKLYLSSFPDGAPFSNSVKDIRAQYAIYSAVVLFPT